MTIAIVQSNFVSNPFTGVTSGTASGSLSSPVTSGNAVLIAFAGASNSTTTPGSATDNKSNSYTQLTFDNTTTGGQGFFLATNITNGPNSSFSVPFTIGSSSPTIVIGVWEISGLSSSPTDVATLLSATSFSTSFNKSFTTAVANEYGFAILSNSNGSGQTAVTLTNGWTQSGTANAYLGGNPHSAFATSSLATAGSNSIQGTTASGDIWNISIVTFEPGTSSYNGVNQLDYSVTTGANSITTTGAAGIGTLAVTAGNLLVAVGYSQNIVGATFTDSLGNVWSNYNPQFTALNGNIGLAGFWCIATYGGTATFTLSAAGISSAIYVGQFDPANTNAGGFLAANGSYVASIGSGAGNATTGNISCGPTNALGFSFCFDPACTASPTTDTVGFSVTTAVWETQQGGTVAPGRQANGLATGTQPFLFSTNNPGDAVYTIGAAFNLAQLNLLMGQAIL